MQFKLISDDERIIRRMTFKRGDRLVIASHNKGKVSEIQDLLLPYGIECVSAHDLNLTEAEETGTTFVENAIIKAKSAASESGLYSLADDSGFAVRALNGDPGVYSARWAGPDRDFDMAMRLVHEKLEDHADKSASFICVLALCAPDGNVQTFEGRVDGQMVWPPRGDKGFGYDPVFIAHGHDKTFAEIDPAQKHAVSHRADAFQKFIAACFPDG